ncbi:restriction endonuclease [Curtobacterium sp. RHCKG23]|uniref:Restriction endonuclease n=1 Tax=Curtobacterium citri TaxID=3055139 RepID=A0ABT7T6I3_9MICO|nr:restriction endonuclease [Curtobacterium citri]MDM7885177.1 restriction endonuclease [Curtobacterium citri]
MTAAWVVRTGRYGERDSWSISTGVTGGGWEEIPDLTACVSRDDVQAVVAETFPDDSMNRRANYTGQLWALRGRIKSGDTVALPLKTTGEIAIGRVTSGYEYVASEPDPAKRHLVRVQWLVQDLPRSAIKQDLLYTLGSALTVFAPSRGFALERLNTIAKTREDPGQLPFKDSPFTATRSGASDDVDEPETRPDIVEHARDQILTKVSETFKGHELTVLIRAILEGEGFVCEASLGGADGGVDIVAGRGLLGMESPKLVAQVKSGGQVGDQIVRDLLGTMQHVGAEQGLLVAWDGVSGPAKASLQRERFRIRLWTATDVVDAMLRVYEDLPEDVQAVLPLRRIWLLAD